MDAYMRTFCGLTNVRRFQRPKRLASAPRPPAAMLSPHRRWPSVSISDGCLRPFGTVVGGWIPRAHAFYHVGPPGAMRGFFDSSLSRLNHRLPRGQAHQEAMQGTTHGMACRPLCRASYPLRWLTSAYKMRNTRDDGSDGSRGSQVLAALLEGWDHQDRRKRDGTCTPWGRGA